MAKSHKIPFNKSSTSPNTFYRVHSDVWGPAPQPSLNSFNYYVIFVDDFSKFSWLYPMHSKHEMFTKFSHFCLLVKALFNSTPKFFRSDGGGEFISNQFQSLSSHGILVASNQSPSHPRTKRNCRTQAQTSSQNNSNPSAHIKSSHQLLGRSRHHS
ncbi:hypothetical protein KFK09_021705 [Dendrobium nobile]|uniref:Integrase catalytic domain-containing protein n=1 Tax=Dendrobium nobile TaxID=94219 RepID=A0A8T3AH50_DENNO|nr:hypothetical protein KFK09_021705 [Dendrobium nobile]